MHFVHMENLEESEKFYIDKAILGREVCLPLIILVQSSIT